MEKVWLSDEITQFDFYDDVEAVKSSADAVAEFFVKQ